MKGKHKSRLLETAEDFASRSTVHGISYIFDPSLPRCDRILWLLCFLAFLVLSAYLTHTSYQVIIIIIFIIVTIIIVIVFIIINIIIIIFWLIWFLTFLALSANLTHTSYKITLLGDPSWPPLSA